MFKTSIKILAKYIVFSWVGTANFAERWVVDNSVLNFVTLTEKLKKKFQVGPIST